MQCICAAITALSRDRRQLGGAPRENINTFDSTAYEKAMNSTKTKWFHKKMRCDKRTFLAVAALVRQNWVGHVHHNTNHNITKRVAVTLVRSERRARAARLRASGSRPFQGSSRQVAAENTEE
ncbi:hypothetical protein PR002_g13194 [Phytophthora rubi]|uniref:DDE Tnp4 domain-containing protein n=1 Tax=Phytophthora rubi TaxID=129364 RepID=A0A6A3LQN9_9STRA|nr:hypothetical protein PR002_g13194 [Phytophthora rubi]